jgi:uncharacterized protein
MISRELVQAIIAQHGLHRRHSIHSVDHWARVLDNGRRLAPITGARLDVVELFAVFHDAGRMNDGRDDGHGARGADLARRLRGSLFILDEKGMQLLTQACEEHTWGGVDADVTVQTCWDSDRLDLGRAAIKPAAHRLCTPAARDQEMIEWAHERAETRFVPCEVLAEWGIDLGEYPGCAEKRL